MRRAHALTLALLALLICALAGCVRVDRAMSLNNDGSGTYKVAVGFSDRLVQGGGASFVNQMAACESRVVAEGGTTSRTDDGSFTTWTFTWHFADIAALNTLLKRGTSFCQASGTSGATITTTNDPVEVTQRSRLITNTYVVRGRVSLLFAQDSVNLQDPSIAALVKDARTSLSITMPLWVTSHTPGAVVSGATITYTAHPGQSTDFEVVGGGPTPFGIAAALGLLALLLIALLILIRFVRHRRSAHARKVILDAGSVAQSRE